MGKQTQYQSTRYFKTIVYLHIIEDNFQNPSTQALDYISIPTVAWFVSAYQEHTTFESIIFIL